jgi:hypothetical protein
MKIVFVSLVSLFLGSAFANDLVKKCQAYDAEKCFKTAMENQKAGKTDEALKLLDAACINTFGPACHMMGLMLIGDKKDAEKLQKGKAALKKGCDAKYTAACDDLKKH